MDNEIQKQLIEMARNVADSKVKYKDSKISLDIRKAKLNLDTNWEEVLGKSKPTVAEKESWIKIETEGQARNVADLKVSRDYCRRVFEINMLANKEWYYGGLLSLLLWVCMS